MCMVLTILQKHLYVKAEKYEFHKNIIAFLGYIIPQRRVCMDSRKVQAVTNWPLPTTFKELQCFLGFTNFYNWFIQNYSLVAAPLTNLILSHS